MIPEGLNGPLIVSLCGKHARRLPTHGTVVLRRACKATAAAIPPPTDPVDLRDVEAGPLLAQLADDACARHPERALDVMCVIAQRGCQQACRRLAANHRALLNLFDFHGAVVKGAAAGHVSLLRTLHETSYCSPESYACTVAAGGRHLDALQYLHDNGYPFAEDTFTAAAGTGDTRIMQWLLDRGCPALFWEAAGAAAEAGHLHALEWLHERGNILDARVFSRAARGGHMPVLQWLTDRRCPSQPSSITCAAAGGHITAMKWLRDRRGCQLNSSVAPAAAAHGHFEALRWAVEQGCPLSGTCDSAAEAGHLDMLKWLVERGAEWDAQSVVKEAAREGHLHVLKWVHARVEAGAHGDVFGPSTWRHAAYGGHVNVMAWLLEIGAPWEENVFSSAAECGHLRAMQWMVEHGVPLDSFATFHAVFDDDVPMVAWLLAKPGGVEIDLEEDLLEIAVRSGQIYTARLLLDAGYPWTDDARDAVIYNTYAVPRLVQWARDNGCPGLPPAPQLG